MAREDLSKKLLFEWALEREVCSRNRSEHISNDLAINARCLINREKKGKGGTEGRARIE